VVEEAEADDTEEVVVEESEETNDGLRRLSDVVEETEVTEDAETGETEVVEEDNVEVE